MDEALKMKVEAINLRRMGKSYGEIRKEIGVAKSTLSYWLKDIPLKAVDRKRLYTKRIVNLSMGSKSQKERRSREVESILKKAREEAISNVSEEAYKLFGVALYWAEGSKEKGFRITNSDPYLILFMVHWFEKVFKIKPNNLKAWLNIYRQQDDVKIKRFWSDLTGIPISNFGKSYIKPVNKGYKKNNLYYGTIGIYVTKGTDLKYKVNGWLQGFLQNLDPKVKSVYRKWGKLRNTTRPINLTKFE
jgi:DNA-binding transcriptional ArsR family regulator